MYYLHPFYTESITLFYLPPNNRSNEKNVKNCYIFMHKRPALRFPAEPFINARVKTNGCFRAKPASPCASFSCRTIHKCSLLRKAATSWLLHLFHACSGENKWLLRSRLFSCRTCKMRPCCHDRIRFLFAMIYTDRTLEPLFRKLI